MGSRTILLLLAVVLFAAGCENQPEEQAKPVVSGKLKIPQTKSSYYMKYGDLIDAAFPELDMQVSEEGERNPALGIIGERYKMFEEQKSDILVLDGIDMYETMLKEGKIVNLESFIARDRFELSGFLPSVTELLRYKGNGNLYGLSAEFFSRALAFNKSLFDQRKLPYPTDRMSWADVMKLAMQFAQPGPGEQKNIGYFTSNDVNVSPFTYVTMIGQTNGLSLVDAEAKELLLGSQEWRNVIYLIMEAYAKGALLPPEMPKAYTNQEVIELANSGDLFKAGRAAMTLAGNDLISKIKSGKLPFEVDFVTAPVDPQMPDSTTFVNPFSIYAIDARSERPDEAWEVIKFIVSDQVARIAEDNGSLFSTRIGVLGKERYGVPLEPFYMQPKLDTRSTVNRTNPKLRPDFTNKLSTLIDRELIAVYHGEQMTDEAIANMQREGQLLLDSR